MSEEFNDWLEKNGSYLTNIEELMSSNIPDQENQLIYHVRLIEAHHARMGCILAEANGFIDVMTHQFFSLDDDMSVKEKELYAKAQVSKVKVPRDKVQALVKSIELRVNLAQSILKQQREERMHGYT